MNHVLSSTRRGRLLPVIHCVPAGIEHATENAGIAFSNGADGIFLIGHGMRHPGLVKIYKGVREKFPEKWIGVNFLDLEPRHEVGRVKMLSAVAECQGLSALWMDTLYDGELGLPPWDIELFGGVAFKYQGDEGATGAELQKLCNIASQRLSVATTSGDKTGSPPSVEKLKKISKYLAGAIPLAVASGVTSENIPGMIPYVKDFIVASSLVTKGEDGNEYFLPYKVAAAAGIIHSYAYETTLAQQRSRKLS